MNESQRNCGDYLCLIIALSCIPISCCLIANCYEDVMSILGLVGKLRSFVFIPASDAFFAALMFISMNYDFALQDSIPFSEFFQA